MSKKVQKKAGLLGGEVSGVNQICPVIYSWAWDSYIKAVANNWVPTEVPMNRDIEQWKSKTDLTDDERLVIKRCLGFFAGSESLVANNLLLSIFRWITNPECRQYIGRQNYEELLHNHTIVYVCDSLSLDISEIYEAYKTVPSIKSKDDFLMEITSDISRSEFNTNSIEGKRELVRNLLSYYVICEGIMFYSGFAMLLSFGRQNKLPGISEQIQYTLRDESLHIQFGLNLINNIKKEYPGIWTSSFEQETVDHIKKAVELEIAYAYDVMPNGILGLNAPMFVDYVQYIANRRLESLGVGFRYKSDVNPFPWMSEVIDLQKNKNFFESRVTDYATVSSKMTFKENNMSEKMTSSNYKSNALRTKSSQFHIDMIDPDLLHAAMGCETEVGEIMDAIKKTLFYGKRLDIVNVKEELGDLLYYVAIALHSVGSDFEEVMTANIAKLRARYPDKFTSEYALFRDLETERKVLESHELK